MVAYTWYKFIVIIFFIAEFYRQGDLERETGLCPLSIMDRSKSNFIPEDQVNLLKILALPCLKVLKQILPNTESLYNDAT